MAHPSSWTGKLINVVLEIGLRGQVLSYNKKFIDMRGARDKSTNLLIR
jgi:hypothetical protein